MLPFQNALDHQLNVLYEIFTANREHTVTPSWRKISLNVVTVEGGVFRVARDEVSGSEREWDWSWSRILRTSSGAMQKLQLIVSAFDGP